MVAAAGETAGLKPRVAIICFAALLVGLAIATYLSVRNSALEQLNLEQTPEVLTQKVREMIAHLGYEGRPADSKSDFDYDTDFVNYVEKNDKPRPNWSQVLAAQPPILHFRYRQSPRRMVGSNFHDMLLTPGVVSMTDPPTTLSGMINVKTDPRGHLLYFQAIPPEKDTEPATTKAVDWSPLFSAAGLDSSQFHAAPPMWNSLASSDARAAWTGVWPGSARPLRIEAAAYHAKPVFFALIGDWTDPPRMKPDEQTGSKKVSQILGLIMLISMMCFAVLLARVNYRRGRSDREGAFRLATMMFVVEIVLWLSRSHLVPGIETLGLFIIAVSTALFVSGLTWLLYLALEPYVRRFWPKSIISWTRALSGRIRDPLVGRDVLFGVMLGTIWLLIFAITNIMAERRGSSPSLCNTDFLLGVRPVLAAWVSQVPGSVLATLEFFFLLLGLKVLLRRDWLAAVAFVAIFATLKTLGSSYLAVEVPAFILIYGIAVLIVVRFGLVPLTCAVFTVNLLGNVPFTADFSAWYATTSAMVLLSVVALATWGFYTSLRRRTPVEAGSVEYVSGNLAPA